MRRLPLFLIPLLLAGAVTASPVCGQEAKETAPSSPSGKAFADALREGTVTAFERFLKDHPGAPEAREARDRLDWLREDAAYERALSQSDEAGYRQFLQEFPTSVLRAEVELRIKALEDAAVRAEAERRTKAEADRRRVEAHTEAAKLGTAEAWRVFLAAYPDAPEAPAIRQQLQSMGKAPAQPSPSPSATAYAQALQEGTVPAFERFLAAHPDAPEAQDARDRIDWLREDAAYEQATARDDEAGYRQFLLDFPRAVLRAEVELRLKALEDARARGQAERQSREEADRRRASARATAEKVNTAEAWRVFLAAYPDSPEVPEAKQRVEVLQADDDAFAAATAEDSLKAYLAGHPDGRHAAEAQSRLAALQKAAAPPAPLPAPAPVAAVPSSAAFAEAVLAGTVEALEGFLRAHPDAPESPAARDRVAWLKEDAAYRRAIARGDESAYKRFLEEHPQGIRRAEVELRLKAAEGTRAAQADEQRAVSAADRQRTEVYAEAARLDTAAAWRVFLAAYGDSPEAPHAKRRIEALETSEARSKPAAAAPVASPVAAEARPEPPKQAEPSGAPPTLTAVFSRTPPVPNGRADDAAWQGASALDVPLTGGTGTRTIRLKAVHDGRQLYLLTQWADSTRDATYRQWLWDDGQKAYRQEDRVDDGLAVLLYRGKTPADSCMLNGQPMEADSWLWRAFWSEISGLAEDGLMRINREASPKGRPHPSTAGGQVWVREEVDPGSPPWAFYMPSGQQGPRVPSLRRAKASGSAADVTASGSWSAGVWTVEFSRALDTRHADDLALQDGGTYAVSLAVYNRSENGRHAASPVVRLELKGR